MSNTTTPKYIKQLFIDLEGEIDYIYIIIVGNLNIPLSING